jgi:hypothetical protein
MLMNKTINKDCIYIYIHLFEQDNVEHKADIRNLIKKKDDFISTIKWGLGIFVTVSIFVMGVLLKK